MDYKFLNKVVDQLVRETRIDYDKRSICSPPSFLSFSPFTLSSISLSLSFLLFSQHCKEVYGLNEDEIDYVWEEYRRIIIDKINNG